MARGVNKVWLLGRLGADPDVKQFQSGEWVANVSIATSEAWKDKDGNKVERTEWHRVVFFNKLAEIVGKYLSKGSQISVIGKLKTEKYEKDGQDRYTTKIIAAEMQMLDSKKNSEPRDQIEAFNPRKNEGSPDYSEDRFEDDIPFLGKI